MTTNLQQVAGGLLTPSSTVFRVRRKRGADPLAGLVVSSKKQKTEAEPSMLAEENLAKLNKKELFFFHVGTSQLPSVKDAARFLDRDHKIVEMVDYDPEGNQIGKPRISVVDRQYLEVMEAARAINGFGIEDQEKRNFEAETTAPLATAEIYDDDIPTSSADGVNYVYDFYCQVDNRARTISDHDNVEVRLPTDEELQLFFGGDDEGADSVDGDDDEDSNAENHYANDYPDEDLLDGDCENDTTSDDDDDSYDHYGDETVEYGSICHDSDIDN